MCELNREEVERAIVQFNNLNYIVTDHLVKTQFTNLRQGGRGYIAGTVLLLDNCFSTNLPKVDAGEIIQSLEEKWFGIECAFGNLQNNPQIIQEVANYILPMILNPGTQNNYSFATKFLHWCTGKHFPIIDSRSRIAIRELTGNNILGQNNPDNLEEILNEYTNLINFSSHCLEENDWFGDDLVAFDLQQQTQFMNLAMCNTPLRILDKYFFITGGGN